MIEHVRMACIQNAPNYQYFRLYTVPGHVRKAVLTNFMFGNHAAHQSFDLLVGPSHIGLNHTNSIMWDFNFEGNDFVSMPFNVVLNPGDKIDGYLRGGGGSQIHLSGIEFS